MSTLEMSKLKGVLESTVNQLGQAGSVSYGAVIEAVRKADPTAISAVTRELEDGMLHRILSQLSTRRPKDNGQADLFEGYAVQQFIGIEVERDGRRTVDLILLSKATLNQLAAWLSASRKTRQTRRQRNPGMNKLLRDLSKVAKGQHEMTVETAIKLLRGRGGG